ncbi:MAG: GNAT family N-acetyltransferase [Clostridia bacterium]|nr:GNAT family N-acetyltransferase [Clostridia bacterium]MBQ6172237.1 GNAT family N-acetyltransferase [Clostridia bacterium]
MPDMLVKLFSLPPLQPELDRMSAIGVTIRRPIGPENYAVIEWIKKYFPSSLWASEAENAFFNSPKTIYIALRENENGSEMLGFACWDATVRNFFGPTGVKESERGKGIGKALLLACLHGMHEEGYAYGIIGSPGPVDFYKKCCGGVMIEDSGQSVYKGMLR